MDEDEVHTVAIWVFAALFVVMIILWVIALIDSLMKAFGA